MREVPRIPSHKQLIMSLQGNLRSISTFLECSDLCIQKARPFLLFTRDWDRNSCAQLHVHCQSEPRRGFNKLHQLNWFSDREHRSPFRVGSEKLPSFSVDQECGALNFTTLWEVLCLEIASPPTAHLDHWIAQLLIWRLSSCGATSRCVPLLPCVAWIAPGYTFRLQTSGAKSSR